MLLKELTRLESMLKDLDPTKEEYTRLRQNMFEILCYIKMKSDIGIATEQTTETAKPEPKEEKASEPVKAEKPKAVKPAKQEVLVEEPPKEEAKEYSYEEVRSALASASESGVIIQPIISKFVPEGKPVKFSSIPKESYTALMEVLNAK